MSKPVFQDVFQFEGRRNRQSYILFQLSAYAILAISIFVTFAGFGLYENGGVVAVGASALILGGIATFIATTVGAWLTSAQRCRDIGWPGWVCLGQLVPYVGWIFALVVAIAPGDTLVENKYGSSLIKGE